MWHYSKASHAGLPLASAYLGAMHHFGLGTRVNVIRATRYYDLALQQCDSELATHKQMEQRADQAKLLGSAGSAEVTRIQFVVQSLKYTLSMRDQSIFFAHIHTGLDYVVRQLWGT